MRANTLSSRVLEALGTSNATAPELATTLKEDLPKVKTCLANLRQRQQIAAIGMRGSNTSFAKCVPGAMTSSDLDGDRVGTPVDPPPPADADDGLLYGILADGRLISLEGTSLVICSLSQTQQIRKALGLRYPSLETRA